MKTKNLIRDWAIRVYEKQEFIKEWNVYISILLVLKLAAMVFSVFAGFFFFRNIFNQLLANNTAAVIFSTVTLLIIELLTALSITKFFKFALRGELKTAVPLLILTTLIFSISFISSTNGLSMRQGKIADNSEYIKSEYNLEKENINESFDRAKEEYISRIDLIRTNPQGWINGKRIILTASQLKDIKNIYSKE